MRWKFLTRQNSKKRASRHHYFLLEVMIALSLVVMCAFPLIQPFFATAEILEWSLEKAYLQRYADDKFARLKMSLDAGNIRIDEIISGLTENYQENHPVEVSLGGKERTFLEQVHIRIHRKNGEERVFQEDVQYQALLEVAIDYFREGFERKKNMGGDIYHTEYFLMMVPKKQGGKA